MSAHVKCEECRGDYKEPRVWNLGTARHMNNRKDAFHSSTVSLMLMNWETDVHLSVTNSFDDFD